MGHKIKLHFWLSLYFPHHILVIRFVAYASSKTVITRLNIRFSLSMFPVDKFLTVVWLIDRTAERHHSEYSGSWQTGRQALTTCGCSLHQQLSFVYPTQVILEPRRQKNWSAVFTTPGFSCSHDENSPASYRAIWLTNLTPLADRVINKRTLTQWHERSFLADLLHVQVHKRLHPLCTAVP